MRLIPLFACAFVLASTAWAGPTTDSVTAKGRWLAKQLDMMGVESKWIAGAHVDWRTGLPDGRPERAQGRHTHCSAFVAAAAESLGVHILRPPEHLQVLLANAQFEWLAAEGASEGWRPVSDGTVAQAAANGGDLVVAAYESHRDDKPGHIAIVKPAPRTDAEIEADGPLVIQAGSLNNAAISLREGFAGHPAAWRDQEVRYYVHAITASGERKKS